MLETILEKESSLDKAALPTPLLHHAVLTKNSAHVQELLEKLSVHELEQKDGDSKTALDLAVQSDNGEIIDLLASNLLLAKETYTDIQAILPPQPALLPLPFGQKWIIEGMKAAGYRSNEKGVCFGFGVSGLQAFYQGRKAVNQFDTRLKQIVQHAKNIPVLKKILEACTRLNTYLKETYHFSLSEWEAHKGQGLTPAQHNALLAKFPTLQPFLAQGKDPSTEIIDLFAFYEAIELYQQHSLYPDWFSGIDCYRVSNMLELESKRDTFTYPCCVYIKYTESDEKKGEEHFCEAGQLLLLSSPEDAGTQIKHNLLSNTLLQKIEETSYAIRLNAKEIQALGIALPQVNQGGQNISAASLLRSKEMEQAGMCLTQTDIFSGLYTKKALKHAFTLLAQHAKEPIGLLIGNTDHAISIGYDPTQKIWTFFDANNPAKRYILGEDALADTVFSSFTPYALTTALALEMQVIQATPAPRQDVLLWKQALAQELLVITPEKAVFLDNKNASWLYTAVRTGETKTVIALLGAGARVRINQPIHPSGDTPLLAAIRTHHLPLVHILLAAGANPNQTNANQDSPLCIAIRKGYTEIAGILLDAQANPDQTDAKGWTPLRTAMHENRIALVALLLDKGATPHPITKWIPLVHAAEKNHIEMAQLLLHKGADINQSNEDDHTALALAAGEGHIEMVRFLLDNHADLNYAREEENRPLFLAVENGHIEIVKILLEKNAYPHLHNATGETLEEVAQEGGHTEIADYLHAFLRNQRKLHVKNVAFQPTPSFLPPPSEFPSIAANEATTKTNIGASSCITVFQNTQP